MWARVDDAWWCHPKVMGLPLAPRGLWVSALSWSCAQRSSHVPAAFLTMVGGTEQDAAALVEAGLWVPSEGGWDVHDWAEYQSLSVSEKRAQAGRRGGQRSGASRRSKSEANGTKQGGLPAETSKQTEATAKQTPKQDPIPSQPNPVTTSISEQPQVLETGPSPVELEQSVNRAVGMVARLRAVNGDNPEALAAHIGRNFPAEDRAELVELIAAGTDVADAAAAVADPLRGFTTSTHGRAVVGFDPDEAEAIRQRARDREQATQDRLRAMAETPAVDPLAAVRDLRAARKAATA